MPADWSAVKTPASKSTGTSAKRGDSHHGIVTPHPHQGHPLRIPALNGDAALIGVLLPDHTDRRRRIDRREG